jgi:FkbM family methyltransferase
MNNSRQRLDMLLSETPAAARLREQAAFAELADGRGDVVIFGAGRLGRRIRAGITGTDLTPIAFADNNPRIWGTYGDGIPVLSPQDAAREYGSNALFVVAIWHPSQKPLMAALLAQLRGLGCRAVAFPLLFWRQSATFLPYFFWELPSQVLQRKVDIAQAFDLLDEEASRQTFLAQLQLRLRADFEGLGSPAPGAQYFPGLFSLSADECFVDCGAYTGDSIRAFISHTDNAYRKVIAFEADPAVLPVLETFIASVGSRAALHRAAVGNQRGCVRFSGDGLGGGAVSAASGVEVPGVRLDDALARERVSFIKMDIEGAELQALEGAHRVIGRDRPVLAVCGYHAPDHLWRVPVSLKSLAPDSRLFVRSHCADGLDTVWYSVPPERCFDTIADSGDESRSGKHSSALPEGCGL